MDYPDLSVVMNNTACVLTLTAIYADQKYTATPSLALTTSYQGSAASFAPSGGGSVSFYANAYLGSASFGSTFTVTVLYSDDPNAATGALAAGYAAVSATSATTSGSSPNYTLDLTSGAFTATVSDTTSSVQSVAGTANLVQGTIAGGGYYVDQATLPSNPSFAQLDTAYGIATTTTISGTPVQIPASAFGLPGANLTTSVVRTVVIQRNVSGVHSYQTFAITFSCGGACGVCPSGQTSKADMSGLGAANVCCASAATTLNCDGTCSNTQADANNCGACGTVCSGTKPYCISGSCSAGSTCAGGSTLCSGICVSTSTDNANCGSCGNACSGSSAQFCSGGQCGSDCTGSFSSTHGICSNVCTDLSSTAGSCGSCSNNCTSATPGSICSSSACACPAGSSLSTAGNCLIGGLVALSRTGWTVSASNNSGSANVAIDGDLTTRWDTGTNQTNGLWYEINLGGTRKFSQITFDVTNNSSDYPGAYAVYVSSDGVSWGSAVTTGTGSSAVVTMSFTQQTAQYIKVQLTASDTNTSHWWSVDEVNVYSANPPTGTPIPQARNGWVATASVSGGATPASNAIDGNTSTYWNTATNQTSGMWFEVAMNGSVTFDQITMLSYMAGGADTNYPGTYAVYVSNDGVNWGSSIATGTGGPTTTITFTPVTASYVQVSLTAGDGYWWTIAEFNVFEPAK